MCRSRVHKGSYFTGRYDVWFKEAMGYLTNEAVPDIVSEYSDPSEVCKALVGIAYNKWSENEERTDDITVIVG